MQIGQILDLDRGAVVSIVGAGGKTTTLFALANELAARGLRVVSTTTTFLHWPRPGETPHILADPDLERLLAALPAALAEHGHVTLVTDAERQDKVRGLEPDTIGRVCGLPEADVVVLEADGARHRLIKAPAAHEPALPPETTHVIAVAGWPAVGRPLSDKVAHRLEQVCALTGLTPGDPIPPEALATLIVHPEGGRKRVPPGAQVWGMLSRVPPDQREQALALARQIAAAPGMAGAILAGSRPDPEERRSIEYWTVGKT
jgi:molybdenum cofactor cytidylyltransferase